MSKNYFSIERNGQCWTPVILADRNGNPAFEEFLNMSYEDLMSDWMLTDFIVAAMEAANSLSDTVDSHTMITLIGKNGVFVWSILAGYDENEHLRYALVDWKKDGKSYRYEP